MYLKYNLIELYVQIQRLSLYKQIELFQGIQDLIREKIGSKEANKFFQQARYVVALGSNDFINNYLMPVYKDSWTYNDKSFIQYLMDTQRSQLTVSHMQILFSILFVEIVCLPPQTSCYLMQISLHSVCCCGNLFNQ